VASSITRLNRLLDRGFYPLELPPPFQTRRFSGVRRTFRPNNNYNGSTTFFDGATFRGMLRTFGVVNPASYFLLSEFIADHWADISSTYRLSSSSGARPKFPSASSDGRAIEVASLATKRKSQQHLASSFPIILGLDINRFYGSIYTHSIPWAALGKKEAKRRYRLRTLTGHWSDTLDKFVRNCNQRQTIGIPIGPDTSRIISELLLSRIDADLCATGSNIASHQAFHNIDDYQIGAFDTGTAETAQSHFIRTISRYELRLNDFKTTIEQGFDFAPSNFQRHFDILQERRDRTFVEHFFELLYSIAPLHPNSNIVGYALKRFAVALATNAEQLLVREYLQRLLFAAPHHARWVMPLLLGIYNQAGVNPEVRRIMAWGVETCARRNDVGSLLWFLYGAIFLRVKLNGNTCSQCIGMSNELVDLVLLHGRNEGLFSFKISELRERYKNTNMQSSGWLPLYEVERRGWDTSPAFQKIGQAEDADGLYEHLNNGNVEFYITDPDYFCVEAFKGWNLTQQDFDPDANEHRRQEYYDILNDYEHGIENYE